MREGVGMAGTEGQENLLRVARAGTAPGKNKNSENSWHVRRVRSWR